MAHQWHQPGPGDPSPLFDAGGGRWPVGSWEQEFQSAPSSVPASRCFVAGALDRCGITAPAVVDDALLVVSELATNSVEHARTPFRVEVSATTVLRIAVVDGSLALPRVENPAALTPRGRGMVIVDRTADRWGTEVERAAKRVWWEVDLRGP